MKNGQEIVKELNEAGFQAGVAVATDAEVEAGSACGQVAFEHLPKFNADGTPHEVHHAEIHASFKV